jgi:hypothetical protein
MLRNRLLDLIRSRFGSDIPPLRLVFPNDDVFNFVPNPTSRSGFVRRRPLKAMLKGASRSVAQVLSFKASYSGEIRRPWTREYQYRDLKVPGRIEPIRFARKLDWT